MIGKWIWVDDNAIQNSYGEFVEYFPYEQGEVKIKIACDSQYNLFLNGELVSFGQFPGYPQVAFFDEVDLTPYLKQGTNVLAIAVWYFGKSSFVYKKADAGVCYEVILDGKTIAKSDKNTLSRYSPHYDSEYKDTVTMQIGYGATYIAPKDDWKNVRLGSTAGFSSSFETGSLRICKPRSNERLVLGEKLPSEIVGQGEFIYADKPLLSAKMHEAFLSFRYLHEITGDMTEKSIFDRPKRLTSATGNGMYFIVDLLSTETGFIAFDIEVDEECYIDVAYGEHLQDGRVRCSIGDPRNFITRYKAQKGKNEALLSMQRVGCRYLQFFVHAKDVIVRYAGMRTTYYPVKLREYVTDNLLHKAIYDTAVKSLQCGMHEHYEDTPWREQALYVLDGGLQMIYGFSAFEENGPFAKSNLLLMTYGLRKDGLLDVTFPSETEMTIPFFSYFYPVVVGEYFKETGDLDLIEQTFFTERTILDTALTRIEENGLLLNYEKPYWNYYEWSEYKEVYPEYSLILNAILSLALQRAGECFVKIGKEEIALQYAQSAERLNDRIRNLLYDTEKGVFRDGLNGGLNSYSELGNAMAILCGACGTCGQAIAKRLTDGSLIPTGLATRYFKYEALCKCGDYAKYILDDIDKTCFAMLRRGATTFWETEHGANDFRNGGSLSHAWSAFAVRYYRLFNV